MAPTRTLNTNVTPVGPIYTIDGGTRTGNNLFHSFATFNLAAGDTAQWVHTTGNPLTVANVINRVTGGTPSQLFGTLDSTAIPNADFYFINPAGIVFGATAQVNVPAAAHFSTASELRFDRPGLSRSPLRTARRSTSPRRRRSASSATRAASWFPAWIRISSPMRAC